MLLAELAALSRRLAETRSRTRKITELADLLARLGGTEVEIGVSFLSGDLRQGKIGLGPAAVRRAAAAPAASEASLTLADADAAFGELARLTGPGSTAERTRRLSALFGRATAAEQEFLIRLVLGELRQGALEGFLVEAVARASRVNPAEVRRALMVAGDLEPVAVAALTRGREGLAGYAVEVFRPLQPMLAQPAADLDAALARLGEAALEWKLDGVRVQVHKAGGDVHIFTRRLNDVTPAVPELVEVARALPARELVLDGEVLLLNPDGGPRPFQTTMARFGRKENEPGLAGERLTPYFFDCLYLDGQALDPLPESERFRALQGVLPPESVVPRLVTADPGEAEAFLREALRRGHEGLMAKDPGSAYEAGRRGWSWLKVKEAHTLDLVVLAAEWGHGRRSEWLSNLHLGGRDPITGGFVMLGKTFEGLTDEVLRWQTKRLQELAVARDPRTVYVRPELVVEIAFSGVQESPRYPAGLALRFARVKRYRPDKPAGEADTIEAVRRIFESSSPVGWARPTTPYS
ncbi:MAG: ATP-dependent DNA ligase [Deltaproteobacteria bacterium]|nr:ATP-dependent DNA ligase [Deltaproteobacteria bacterium]